MKKLRLAKKITLATLKSFARRNNSHLYVKDIRSFSGMTDAIEEVDDEFKETTITDDRSFFKTGIVGLYTVGQSRDYFNIYEDENYEGIKLVNCCNTTILAKKKL